MKKKAHPAAELLPMIVGKDLDELVADVKANGLLQPITLTKDGLVLDGRNRLVACERAGVEPRFETYQGEDPIAFVMSANVHRRHMTDAQRTIIAAKLANLGNGSNQHAKVGASIEAPSVSQADAAKMMKVSRASVQRARKVVAHGVPELVEAVERGEASINEAVSVAAMPAEQQRVVMQEAKAMGTKVHEVIKQPRGAPQVRLSVVPPAPPTPAPPTSTDPRRIKRDALDEKIADLLKDGSRTTNEVAAALGIRRQEVYEAKTRLGLTKSTTSPLARLCEFADEAESFWRLSTEHFTPKWSTATPQQREEATKRIQRSIDAAKKMIARLNKEAAKGEES